MEQTHWARDAKLTFFIIYKIKCISINLFKKLFFKIIKSSHHFPKSKSTVVLLLVVFFLCPKRRRADDSRRALGGGTVSSPIHSHEYSFELAETRRLFRVDVACGVSLSCLFEVDGGGGGGRFAVFASGAV